MKKLFFTAAMMAPLLVKAQQRPNIVYIMTDDHTAQMMSCYDTRYVETPNLDRIAQDGVRFANSYVANSLSGPSRACMLTGKHSHKNGFTNNEHGVFDGSQQTMPKLLQKAGYQTVMIGKWHLHSTPTGFDYFDILPGQGSYYNPDFIGMDGKYHREQGYVTNIVTDKAIDWMTNKRDPEKPFCIFIHHKACHRDWLPELKYLTEYEDKVFTVPETFWDDYEGRPAAASAEMNILKHMDMGYDCKLWLPGLPQTELTKGYFNNLARLSPQDLAKYNEVYAPISNEFYSQEWTESTLAVAKFQRYMRDYAKVLKSLDDNVGRTLKYLEDNGLLENTLVVYTSDQGFYMGEHGWFDKRFMYEESLNTPLVMMLPKGYERRGVIDQMVQNIDYAPTFLDLAGAEIPADIQGVSLLPLLKKAQPKVKKWRDAIYYHFYEYPAEHAVKRHYGIRTQQYSLMHFYNDIDVWELYDLKADPQQMHNIYNEADPKLKEQLHAQLRKLQEQYDDPIESTLAK